MDDRDMVFRVPTGPGMGPLDEDFGRGPVQTRAGIGSGSVSDSSNVSIDESWDRPRQSYLESKVLSLMGDITRGFDPTTLPDLFQSLSPNLLDGMFPGSFKHLLILLLGDPQAMTTSQLKMDLWLQEHFMGDPLGHNAAVSMIERSYLDAEVETLRKLLEPLRGDNTGPVFWVNHRTSQAASFCKELKRSKDVLERFESDLVKVPTFPADPDPRNFKMVIGPAAEASHSLRQTRIDGAAATLQWDNMNGSGFETTKICQAYHARIGSERLMGSRDPGFFPPVSPRFPTEILAGLVDIHPLWSANKLEHMTLDVVFKIAIWLALARGFAAVHMYCDIARHFTSVEPKNPPKKSLVSFLRCLVSLRPSSAIRIPSDAVPLTSSARGDPLFPGRRSGFMNDIVQSHRGLMEELYTKLTLVNMPRVHANMEVFNAMFPPEGADCTKRRITMTGERPTRLELIGTVTGARADKREELMDRNVAVRQPTRDTTIDAPLSEAITSAGASVASEMDVAFYTSSNASICDATIDAPYSDTFCTNAEDMTVEHDTVMAHSTSDSIEDPYSSVASPSSSSVDRYVALGIEDTMSGIARRSVGSSINDADDESNADIDGDISDNSEAVVSTDASELHDSMPRRGRHRRRFPLIDRAAYDFMDDDTDDYDAA